MSNQKVLYVFGGEKASGAEIVMERLINYNLENVEPHLFISPGNFSDALCKAGKAYPIIIVERLRKLNRSSESKLTFYIEAVKNYLIISSLVTKYIKKNQIKYIHANTIVPASYLIPAIIYSRIFGAKRRWFWSDHDLRYFSKLDHLLSKICAVLYDKTLTVSKAVKAKYGLIKSVEVLYNGLDINFFKPDDILRKEFRTKNKLFEINIAFGIAATISPRKGQLLLVESFKEIQTELPETRLIIAGRLSDDTPSYNSRFNDAIAGEPRILYVGQLSEMTSFYNGCDVVINNSSIEGGEPLGTTIYEAMACEKIVIASKTGGTPEIIEDSVDGFLFEPENKEAIKKMIKYIVSKQGNLETIKRNARKKVEYRFSINRMAKKYNNFIRQDIKRLID